MRIHGREFDAVSKLPEISCSKNCLGGTHVDVVWVRPGYREPQVVGMYYAMMATPVVSPFEARRLPQKDHEKHPLALSRNLSGETTEPHDENTEAWEVRWRWADDVRKSHLN